MVINIESTDVLIVKRLETKNTGFIVLQGSDKVIRQ